jgi:hypothetical protein
VDGSEPDLVGATVEVLAGMDHWFVLISWTRPDGERSWARYSWPGLTGATPTSVYSP